MITFPKIKWEYFVIAVLIIFLLLDGCNRSEDPEPVVKVRTEVITKTDTVWNTKIKEVIPERIHVIETPDKIIRVDPSKVEEPESVKQVNRYRDTLRTEGLTVFGEILSEGRVLEHNLFVESDHHFTTITETKIKNAGGLFFSPAIGFSPVTGVESLETGITYIKGSWGVGAGVFYNMHANTGGFKITLHKKLF